MKRAARIALWTIGALMWLAVGSFCFAAACCKWVAPGADPLDWAAAIGFGLLLGCLAGAGF